jgi:tetratricopeptide (TPR) repeat protein
MIGQESPLEVPDGAGWWQGRWRVPAVCLALAAITFAVFGQTLTHEFVAFDDDDYVYNNPVVARGLTFNGILWAFGSIHACNWHPLTWLSHMLDCQLYGLNPAGHHLTNVLLHTATVITLFLVLRQMTGALWRSAFVAAVFAIHPLRVESVAWVAERKDVLSGLFFMLTIGAYVRYARLPWSPVRYGLVMLLFALGLMCKPMLVTLPLVLLLLDYWPLKRAESAGRLVMEKLPLLALSAASSVTTLLAQHEAMHLDGSFSLPLRLGNALVTCMIYLCQMVWPAGLAVYYAYPHSGLPQWEFISAGALLAGLSAVAAWQRRTQPWILAGWLWYLVMLLPVIGVIQTGDQAHADRYTYLPQIGIYVAVTWLVAEWGAKRKAVRTGFVGLMTGVVGVLMVCAWKQAAYWKDGETLWTHALSCATGNEVARVNPGNNPNQKGGQYLAIIHYNIGIALRQRGNVDEAIAEYQKALQINPEHAAAHINLGSEFLQKGKADEAIAHFQKALQINPGYGQAHNNLGNAFLQKGNAAEAIGHYQQALELEPDDPWPKNILAWLLATCPEASLRNGAKAVELARQANALTGGENPIILHTLAAAFAEAGRYSEAVETAQHALRLAGEQSKTGLAAQLQSEMKLYQSGRPLHISAQTH